MDWTTPKRCVLLSGCISFVCFDRLPVIQVLRDVDTSILRTLSTHQKRVLIAQNLQRILVTSRSDAQVQLSTLEMLMLLIWRHLEQYAEPSSMNVPPAKMNVSNAMRLLVNVGRGGTAGSPGDRDPEAFRRDVGTKIGPVLSRIGGLDLVSAFSSFCS